MIEPGMLQPWMPFYTAIGTASAALLGLLFVVVSINVSAALGPEQAASRRLTEQAFQNYLAVMLVSFLALFPGIGTAIFGMVVLVTTGGGSIWVVVRLCQTLAQPLGRRSWFPSIRRHTSSLIGYGILLVSAFRMTLGWGTSYNLLAAAMLILLFAATVASWEVLLRIARHRSD